MMTSSNGNISSLLAVPVNSPHKGQWRGALVFSLICVWINGWVNSREAADLRRYRTHYDVIVMTLLLNTWRAWTSILNILIIIWINIVSGNGLAPTGEKPLPRAVLNYCQLNPRNKVNEISIKICILKKCMSSMECRPFPGNKGVE